MSQKLFIAFATLLLSCFSIQIPLKQGEFKCMLVYAIGHDQTVKIDVDLPYYEGWKSNDHYFITFRNTQTFEVQKEERPYGRFRRQISVQQQVIYEFCFELISQYEVIGELMVDYNADTYHMGDKNSIKIPDSLLKINDVQEIYKSSYKLTQIAYNYEAIQADLHEKQQQDFHQTQNSESKIMLMSIVEICFILGITLLQSKLIKKKFDQGQSPFTGFAF